MQPADARCLQVQVSAGAGSGGHLGRIAISQPGWDRVIAADIDHEAEIAADSSPAQAGDIAHHETG